MPSKGDDLYALTAGVVVEHLKNRDAFYTPPGSFPERSDKTVDVDIVYEQVFVEVNGVSSLRKIAIANAIDLEGIDEDAMLEFKLNTSDFALSKFRVAVVQPETNLVLLMLEGPHG